MFDNLLEMILDNIPYSVWLKSNEGKFVFVNQYFCDNLNMKKENVLGKTIFEIHGEEFGREYSLNYKEVEKAGIPKLFTGYQDDKFIECYLAPIKKEDKIVAYLGIKQDQTERKKYENEIIKQKNLLKTLIDTIPDCIFYKDVEGNYLDCNVSFANTYYNCDKEDIIGKKDADIINSSDLMKDVLASDEIVIQNKEKHINHIMLEDKEEVKYLESIKTPLLDDENKVWGIVGVARDITQRTLNELELKKITYTDKLTGVYNRTYFDKELDYLNQEKYLPLSFIMGDVDGLKIVNDTMGHLKGDELLVQIANVLKKVCNDDELIVRWGGDEFVILLKNTEYKKAQMLCEKIKLACKNEPYTSIPLSISLGCASKVNITTNIDKILKEAEDKLYKEKLPGRIDSQERNLKSLHDALTEKSIETKEHTDRVVYYAKRLGEKMKLNSERQSQLIALAKLHDIGKIGIPDNILLKPGKLTDKEFDIIKTHTEKGYRVAKSNYEIAHIANYILAHHERWDGSGYPLGLKGKEIPFLARIIGIVDSYDAMTSKRVYKTKISNKEAIEEIKRCSGSQFDPEIVKIFVEEFSEQK